MIRMTLPCNRTGGAVEAAGGVRWSGRDVVVVDPVWKIRRRARMTVAAVEIRRRRARAVLRTVNGEAVEQHADEHRPAVRGQPQRLDMIVILIRRRRVTVVPIEREDL